jgi:enoyl-CoA hydratase
VTDHRDIIFEIRDGVGHVLLNRPEALNALTLEMCVALDAKLKDWAADSSVTAVLICGQGSRAFCAGGDIRRLYDEGRAGSDYPRRFYRAEYRLNARIHRFPKPYVAFLDGIVMGGGVGVSIHGSHRIATENTIFAMPETGIGLFPDVGAGYVLSRRPGAIGMYLGLTGARLRAADAIHADIAQAFVDAARLDELAASLAGGVDAAVVAFARDAGDPPLAEHRALIDRCFSLRSVEDIEAALERESDPFAADILATLGDKSPTSLKIAHRQIEAGRGLDFDDVMRMEWRIVNRVVAGHDFYEGTRAAVIDKDRKPVWKPARISEVTAAEVSRYFAPLDEELSFDWEK